MVYTHALAAILALALGLFGGWQAQGWRLGEQIESLKKAQAEAVVAAITDARKIEQARFSGVQNAQAQAVKRAQVARADSDRARTELSRLRDAIAAGRNDVPGDTCGAGLERTDTAGQLLDQCGSAVTDLAAIADRLNADRLMLLESWPR